MQNARVKFIHFTPHFLKAFERLPAAVQRTAQEKDRLFLLDPFNPRLKTHKLKGSLAGVWAYSVNRNYRVLFRFIDGGEAIYYDIGTHDIYR